jgi:hypothetical protein
MSNMDVSATLQAARKYVSHGMSVIPIHPRGKKPTIPWKEYQQRPPTDEELVQWFGNGAKNNIGIVTGPVSGLAVVDLDSDLAFAFAKKKHLSPTPTVKTGRGFHVYCKAKDGVRNFQQRDDLPDIDLRADGGYVVAPPSVHESGRVYGWVKGRGLGEIEMTELPLWVLAEKPEEKIAVGKLYQGVENGSRNKALARLVGSWVKDGGSLDDIKEQSFVWNSGNADPLPQEEVERTVKSIYERHYDWPDPEPIHAELHPVQTFPFEILPEPFKAWVEDVSYRMQCPPDFVAVAVMVEVGSIIGTRFGIKPKEKDPWLVIPNLWGAVVGRPSMLKSPALAEALKPMGRLEAKAKIEFDEKARQREIEQMQYEAIKASLQKNLSKSVNGKGDKSIDVIKHDLLTLEEPGNSTMKRYRTNDATVEKLYELLDENPTGLLLFRDELVGLLAGWEKQGRETDRAFFLEAWNGDGSNKTDRIGRGSMSTEFVCVSLLGGIQPSKLTAYLQQMNGLQNDGLVQRLQLLVYPDEPVWKNVDENPDLQAEEQAYDVIEKLANYDFGQCVNTGSAETIDLERFFSLHFSDEAQPVFNEWLADLELNKLKADDHPLILEHLGKYRSLMPTLALIIHLIECMDTGDIAPVSVQAATKAVIWCEYLESHARRVYGLITDSKQQSAAMLAKKIQAGKVKDGFTLRDIYRMNWHLLNTKELVQAACSELLEAGWLREEATPPAFRQKGKVEYRINPKIN